MKRIRNIIDVTLLLTHATALYLKGALFVLTRFEIFRKAAKRSGAKISAIAERNGALESWLDLKTKLFELMEEYSH